MNRIEENEEIIEAITRKYAEENLNLKTIEGAKILHLGGIVSILGDISKSLAVIADTLSAERNREHE